MPFCPQCRNEYEPRIQHCVECDKDLVEKLEDDSASDPSEEIEKAVSHLYFDSEALCHKSAQWLNQNGIPVKLLACTPEKVFQFIVPAQFANHARAFLSSDPRQVIFDVGISPPRYRVFDPARDLLDHPVLKEGLDQLRSRGSAAIQELLDCVQRGIEPVAVKSGQFLFQLGKEGYQAFVQAVLDDFSKNTLKNTVIFFECLQREEAQDFQTPSDSQVNQIKTWLNGSDKSLRDRARELAEIFGIGDS